MSKIKYVKNAPKSVIEHYEEASRNSELDHNGEAGALRAKKTADAFEKLLTYPVMESVWRKLASRERTVASYLSGDRGFVSFCFNVIQALEDRSAWDHITPKERKEKNQEIIKLMRTLSREVGRYNVGLNTVAVFTDEELNGMHLLLHGLGCKNNKDLEIEFKNNPPPKPPYERLVLRKSSPTLSELLERYACKFEEEPPYIDSVITQPSAENSDLIYFIRKVCILNYERYDTGLHAITADIASVFFPNESITEDTVRFAMKALVKE